MLKVRHSLIAIRHFALVIILGTLCVGVVHTQTVSHGPVLQLDQVHATAGVTCANCHVTVVRRDPVRMETCRSCHGTGAALAATTAQFKPTNPHQNPHYGTETDCNQCHHQHQPSVNLCSGCHTRFDFKVP
jgi:hypothetical protein